MTMPTAATLANAKDRLSNANFKHGKAQIAAIMSSAVARQDAEHLRETTLERDAADAEYRAIVAALTVLPGQLAEANAAQVRERAADVLDAGAAAPPPPAVVRVVEAREATAAATTATHAAFGDVSKPVPIEAGDTVRLSSGGPDMRVQRIRADGQVECTWETGSSDHGLVAIESATFDPVELALVHKDSTATLNQAQG